MKKYLMILALLGLAAAGIYYYCDKSSKSTCVRNLDKYKAALKVILDNKDQIVRNNIKPDTKWEKQIVTRNSIEKLNKKNADFQKILNLWDKGLISDEYGIMINNDWESIDFDLPGKGRSLTYLPSDKFIFTCASGITEPHEHIEKNWYYVYYCPE